MLNTPTALKSRTFATTGTETNPFPDRGARILVAGRSLPGGAMSVASKERPAPWDGPAILLSDQDALGLLLFLPALSHLIGLRLVGRVIRIWRRLLVGHRSFPLHKLADDHGLDRCGDSTGRTALTLDAWALATFIGGRAVDAAHSAPNMMSRLTRMTQITAR